MNGLKIGDKVWFKGDEVTITSEPFILHGGEFQRAVTEGGKEIVLATPAQKAKDVLRAQEEYQEQQTNYLRFQRD